jgi:O-antigen ligase
VRLAAAALLLTVPLALVVSVDRALSWEVAGYLLYGPVVAAALVSWPPLRRRPQWIAWLLMVGTVGLALAGPLVITDARLGASLLLSLQMRTAPLTAALGETMNPNILANALLVGMPLLLSLALFGGWSRLRGWGQMLCSVATLVVLLTLLLTDSRGAWMALAVILPLLLVLRWPTLAYAVPLLVMGVLTLGVLTGPQLLDQLTVGPSTSGFAQRVEIWQRGLWLIHSFPASGAGLGTFSRLVPVLNPYDLISAEVSIPDAHNLPIQVGVDLGVAGLVAWLALTLLLGWMAAVAFGRSRRWALAATLQPPVADEEATARRAAQRAHALRRALAAGALASVVAGLVAGIFAAANWGVKPAFLPWLVGALIVLLYAQNEEQERITGAPGFSPAKEGAHAKPE